MSFTPLAPSWARSLRKTTTTTKNHLTAQDPSRDSSTPASFLDLPLRRPRPRSHHWKPASIPHPTRKLLFKDFLPSPEKPGALAIQEGSRCSLFSKKTRNCHFRGMGGRNLMKRSGARRRGKGEGQESPARPIASPALSPPLCLGPAPPASAPCCGRRPQPARDLNPAPPRPRPRAPPPGPGATPPPGQVPRPIWCLGGGGRRWCARRRKRPSQPRRRPPGRDP